MAVITDRRILRPLRDEDDGPVTVECARCPERPFVASALRLDITRPGEVRSSVMFLCPRCAAAMWYVPDNVA